MNTPFIFVGWTNANVVPRSTPRSVIPSIQRFYATIPAVTSPAQTPALQRSSEPKKGVMDYVLTSADAVDTEIES
jgi:hypothetical protein